MAALVSYEIGDCLTAPAFIRPRIELMKQPQQTKSPGTAHPGLLLTAR